MPVTYGQFVDEGGAVYNVKHTAFGAVGDGSTDDTAAIQAAIDQVQTHGGMVFIPEGTYRLTASLTIGAASAFKHSVILQGVRPVSPFSGSIGDTTFIWDSTTNHGPMLKVYCAFGGKIDSINFNGNAKADYGVAFQHDATAGGLSVEHWTVSNCSFSASKIYNVLLGATDSDSSNIHTGDVSLVGFYNCYFQRTSVGSSCPTVAHIRQRSSNGLSNACYNCQFDGDGTYPTYGASIMSGTINFYSMVSVGIGTADLQFTGETGQYPGSACVYAWESQSANFLRASDTATSPGVPIRPTVLNGVDHSDITGTGAESIIWSFGGWGPLVLEGCRFTRDVKIDNIDAKVFVLGVVFDSIGGHGIRQPTGASTVSGTWYEYPQFKSILLDYDGD